MAFFSFAGLVSAVLAQSGYDYTGGVALRYPNTSCPAGTIYGGTSYEANCCAIGQYIAPQGSKYCCPTGKSSQALIYLQSINDANRS
jgi:hypothetical protein